MSRKSVVGLCGSALCFFSLLPADYRKKPNDWTVNIASSYNVQYTGGGDEGLIDGLRGTVDFATSERQNLTPVILDYMANISPIKARYVRVRPYNLGKITAWHPGADNDAFIFVYEIIIN